MKARLVRVSATAIALLAALLLSSPQGLKASPACANGDTTQFRSAASGNWNSTSTWECSDDGSTWESATVTPTSVHGAITIRDGHTVTVTAAVTVDDVMVESGGQITINNGVTFTISLATGIAFVNNGTVSGTGTFRTQGTGDLGNNGTFSAPLEVYSGTTSVNTVSTFGGTISILSGATLIVAGGGSLTASSSISVAGTLSVGGTLIANNDVTVTGTLSGAGTFTFNGSRFTNDGTVTVAGFELDGTTQTLTGTGSFSSNTTTIQSSSTLTLGSDHQMSIVVINGAMNISSRTLSISGSGTPLTNNGTLTTTGSTIVYNGSAAQTVATTNVTYNNLTINNITGVTLSVAESVPGTLTLTSGVFTTGNNLTLGDGATISRAAGSLSATPTFGATVNVEYTGSTAVTSGSEIPTASTTLNNLTVGNSGGVTLATSPTVNGTLTINSGATLTAKANGSISVKGNWSNSGTFAHNNGTVTLSGSSGTQTISGNTAFYNLTLDNSGATTSFGTSSTSIANALHANTGTMQGSTSTVTFTGGSGSITGVRAKEFYNLGIGTGASISNSSGGNTTIKKDFTNSGTFAQDSGLTTTFDATGTHNLSGSGTTTFGNITIQGGVTVNAGSHNFSVTGSSFNITNANGVFNGGTATVTFNGSTTLGSGAGTINFNNVTINATKSLTNTTNNKNFGVSGNWTNNGTYTAGTETITFNGTSAQTIGGSSATTFNNLTLNNSSGVTLNTNATVNGTLALTSGDLTTGSNTLTMGSSATSSGSGDVIGTVARSHSFSTGANYVFGNLNVLINFSSVTTGTSPSITLALTKSKPTEFTKAIARKYTVTPSDISAYNATLRLRYTDTEVTSAGENEASLKLWRFNSGTKRWELQSSSVNTTDNYVSASSVTAFSDWAIASSGAGSPTAVTIASFTVQRQSNQVLLAWTTTSELDNLGFNVLRSDALNGTYARINAALIPGCVGCTGASYSYADTTVSPGKTFYYKLQSVDVRGNTELFGPIPIAASTTQPFVIYLPLSLR